MKPQDKPPIELYQEAKEDKYKADKNDPIRLLAYLDKMGIDFNNEGAKIKEGDSKIIYNALCDLTRANLKALAAQSEQIRQLQEEVEWKNRIIAAVRETANDYAEKTGILEEHISELESLLSAEKDKHGEIANAAFEQGAEAMYRALDSNFNVDNAEYDKRKSTYLSQFDETIKK